MDWGLFLTIIAQVIIAAIVLFILAGVAFGVRKAERRKDNTDLRRPDRNGHGA